MLRRLQIIKKSTGQQIIEYSLSLDDEAANEDYFKTAWYMAVDDGVVIEANKIDYKINFAEDTPTE